VANDRLYLALEDGTMLCFAGEGKPASPSDAE